jgi:lysozyme
MSISSKGLDFIKGYEKLRLKIYKDQAGYETIGYGHKVLPGEDFSKGITKAQALDLLKQDVQGAVDAVNAGLKVSVKQNQFDALVSLAFNAGPGSVAANHQMMQAVNAGPGHVTEANFTAYKYIHVNGKPLVSQGLLNRREAEYKMFSEGGQ